MKDNVLIFGAGASYAAKVPLLSNFMDKLCEMSLAGNSEGNQVSDSDLKIFRDVMRIRNKLDAYHGRIKYDDRNIEDILSLLSFNAVTGERGAAADLSLFVKAISLVIENTCTVKHDGSYGQIQETGAEVYRKFWRALFSRYFTKGKIPTIVTFNYDLVLERALMQELNSLKYNAGEARLPFDKVTVEYHFENFPTTSYQVKYCDYRMEQNRSRPGVCLETTLDNEITDKTLHVEMLKLHGSQNFPRKHIRNIGTHERLSVPSIDPYILPPIFNKINGRKPTSMWKQAHSLLRNCKNATIVGYSMPTTDIYMQYFLKSGFGPNVDLNKIFVFDPILFQENRESEAKELVMRYKQCFSQQMQKRIVFDPQRPFMSRGGLNGSFQHFVDAFASASSGILF